MKLYSGFGVKYILKSDRDCVWCQRKREREEEERRRRRAREN